MALSDGHAKYLRKKEIRLHFSEIVKAEGEFLPYACLRKSPVEPSFSLASGMDLPVSSCLNWGQQSCCLGFLSILEFKYYRDLIKKSLFI